MKFMISSIQLNYKEVSDEFNKKDKNTIILLYPVFYPDRVM